MATFTVNKNATTAAPASKTGRVTAYVEVQRVDFSTLNSTTGVSSGDIISVMQVPKWSYVTFVTAEVITGLTRTSGTSTPVIKATISLNSVNFLSQQALTTAGPLKLKAAVLASIFRKAVFNSNVTTKQVSMNITTLSGKCASGVVNVYMYVQPLSGINS